jgi:hypothetical protein
LGFTAIEMIFAMFDIFLHQVPPGHTSPLPDKAFLQIRLVLHRFPAWKTLLHG